MARSYSTDAAGRYPNTLLAHYFKVQCMFHEFGRLAMQRLQPEDQSVVTLRLSHTLHDELGRKNQATFELDRSEVVP